MVHQFLNFYLQHCFFLFSISERFDRQHYLRLNVEFNCKHYVIMLFVYSAGYQTSRTCFRRVGIGYSALQRICLRIYFFFTSLCILQIFVLLDEQRVTLKAEVDPSLIEQNKEEFIRLQNTIYC